jgi:hypothetical protein
VKKNIPSPARTQLLIFYNAANQFTYWVSVAVNMVLSYHNSYQKSYIEL